MNEELSRHMPFSLEAEQAVLGAILIEPDRMNDVTGVLTSDDFFLGEHREIYLAMQKMFVKSRDIDAVTLVDELVKGGVYDDAGGREYIKLLAEIVPTASNIRDYAGIVRDKALLRSLIDACTEITESAYVEEDEAQYLLEAAEAKIYAIAEQRENKNFIRVSDAIERVYEHLSQLVNNREEAIGMPTGFSGLDNVLVGMAPSDLILIGARPGMGKTSFAMNVAVAAAKRSPKAVCVFSLEMSAEQLVTRLLSSEALVNSYHLRNGELSEDEYAKLAHASASLAECNILIDDTSGMTVAGMKSKLRRVKNLGMIIIDYLQLMQSERRIDNRVQEVADISRSLKLMAKEFKVPVICCAQLSRGPESRTDKRPMLSDLRDSGAIEQDADVVLFLYKDDYYKTKDDPKNPQGSQNTAEVIVAKNRHGSTANVKMGWIGEYTKFTTLADDEGRS